MQTKTRKNCKDLTLTLLKLIAAGGGAALLYGASGGTNGKRVKKVLSQYARWRVEQTLKRIRLRNLVSQDEKDELEPIALTEKGWRRLTLSEAKEQHGTKIQKWDLLWRIIIFDISNNLKRNLFRRDLKKIGWKKLQQSVYVNPVGDVIRIMKCVAHHRLQGRCVILTAADLGPFEKPLRKYFFGSQ